MRNPKPDPITAFQLEVMRLREEDLQMLQQIQQKNGPELVAFVCDWWDTRSRQILMEMTEAGEFDHPASLKIAEQLKAQELTSWRDFPPEWRRQFGVTVEL